MILEPEVTVAWPELASGASGDAAARTRAKRADEDRSTTGCVVAQRH